MSRAKILGAVVIALAVLFFVGIGVGATRHDGGPSTAPSGGGSPLDGLRRKLAATDLEGACLDRAHGTLAVAAGQTCRVTVPGSWYPLRRLTLRLETGTTAAITLQQKGTLAEKRALAAGKLVDLDVYTEPATLQLSCTMSCVVQIR